MMEKEIFKVSQTTPFHVPVELTFNEDGLDLARRSILNLSSLPAISDLRLTFERKLPPKHQWMFMGGDLIVVHASQFETIRERIIDHIEYVELEPWIVAGKLEMRPTEADARYVGFCVTRTVDCFDAEKSVWAQKASRWSEKEYYLGVSNIVLKEINALPPLFKIQDMAASQHYAPKAFAEELVELSRGTVTIESVEDFSRRRTRYKEEDRSRAERAAAANPPTKH